MKKSMFATAVVAAVGLAATANANWFQIQSASVVGTSLTTPTGTYTSGNSSGTFNITASNVAQAGASGVSFTGTSGNAYVLSQANANAIVTAIGLTGNGSLAYFGFDSNGATPAYFGIAFIGHGGTVDWTMGNANIASLGVYSSFASQFGGNTWETAGAGIATTAGVNYVAIFAGVSAGTQMGGGQVSDSSINVNYLTYSGGWSAVATATGATSSSLNYATYQVPVPAPVLLAGAGLLGAAAVRRRFAK